MQQQTIDAYDLKAVCEKSSQPCRRDSVAVEVSSRVFGRLRVSRCNGICGHCGEVFVEQLITGHEMPLHVLGREDSTLADICWNALRMGLRQVGRESEVM